MDWLVLLRDFLLFFLRPIGTWIGSSLKSLERKKRRIMRILISMLFITLAYAQMQLFWPDTPPSPPEIGYTQFLNRVEKNEIQSVRIYAEPTTTGYGKSVVSMILRDLSEERVRVDAAKDQALELLRKKEIPITFVESLGPYIDGKAVLYNIGALLGLACLWLYFIIHGITPKGEFNLKFWQLWQKKHEQSGEKTTFKDVAGIDEVKEDLMEIVDFLKGKRKSKRMPKGTLLVGPPGVGKTLLARAVAGEAGVPFHFAKGSDFVEMFVGVGASRVRKLFNTAKAQTPCVIFIDEIDAVGGQRIANPIAGQSEYQHATTELLGQMDGFEQADGIHVMAATNNPEGLDAALKRPGRFDRTIVVPHPDSKGRVQILKVHTRNVELHEDVDFTELALGTPGFSGADLANIANEADLSADREGLEKVHMRHFVAARDKVLLGAERKSMVLSEKDQFLIAVHEAGHAVIALRTEGADPIEKITCMPTSKGAGGVTIQLPKEERIHYPKSFLLGRIRILMGGRAAEHIFFGDDVTAGASQDIEQATSIASNMVCMLGMSEAIGPIQLKKRSGQFLGRSDTGAYDCSGELAAKADAEIARLISKALQESIEIVKEEKDALQRIADELVIRKHLDSNEIQLLREGRALPPLQTDTVPLPENLDSAP